MTVKEIKVLVDRIAYEASNSRPAAANPPEKEVTPYVKH